MRMSLYIAALVGFTSSIYAQTIYYAVASGQNYQRKTWSSAPLAAYNAARPGDVYDSYTIERHPDGTTVVHRDYTTPSGDWRFELTYEYGRDTCLRKIRSEFVTFGGITISGEDEGLTRCVRTFTISRNGTLHKTYERITDEKSGRVVARQFYEPQIKHWMSLDELPIHPKT
jgi:hypothetical protein